MVRGRSDTQSTITYGDEASLHGSDDLRMTLTILFHPDVTRIGEVAQPGATTELSRKQPLFTDASGGMRALDDPVLSRRPVRLERLPSGTFAIQPASEGSPVHVDGRELLQTSCLSAEILARGVVLTLARRVVLLWHLARPHDPGTPDIGLIGISDGLSAVRQAISRVAGLDVPVLIRGESGVGKELVARAIHERSERRARPLVCVNMGAVTPGTAISELFGHKKGAFTGAAADHDGYFAQADGGTLFLDEIGEAAPEVQVMLLRVLETGEIRPLGSKHARRVDVRLLTATDTDLERAVASGGFRRALLHRLASFEIHVPPLRARRPDIGLLFIHFLREELAQLGESGRLAAPEAPGASTWLPPRLIADMTGHAWPGNVRQLRNAARQVAITNVGREKFELPEVVRAMLSSVPPVGPVPADEPLRNGTRPNGARIDISDDALIAALRANDWRAGPAAEALGIARASLYRLMSKSSRIRSARDLSAAEILACAETCSGDLDAMAKVLEVSRRALKLRMTELGLS